MGVEPTISSETASPIVATAPAHGRARAQAGRRGRTDAARCARAPRREKSARTTRGGKDKAVRQSGRARKEPAAPLDRFPRLARPGGEAGGARSPGAERSGRAGGWWERRERGRGERGGGKGGRGGGGRRGVDGSTPRGRGGGGGGTSGGGRRAVAGGAGAGSAGRRVGASPLWRRRSESWTSRPSPTRDPPPRVRARAGETCDVAGRPGSRGARIPARTPAFRIRSAPWRGFRVGPRPQAARVSSARPGHLETCVAPRRSPRPAPPRLAPRRAPPGPATPQVVGRTAHERPVLVCVRDGGPAV